MDTLDIAILVEGANTEESSLRVQLELEASIEWGRKNAAAFAPDKAELIHFYRDRKPHAEGVLLGDQEVKPSASVRWLGVILDSRLSFKKHVETWAGKALIANFLKSLNKTRKGSPVAIAAKACMAPVALYGMEAWWPGHERQSYDDRNKTCTGV